MALLGSSAVGAEVGLRLLLSPVSSTIISRTACVVVGVGFPVYSTFKALESKNRQDQEKWLLYWAVYGCVSVAEIFSDKLLSWFPYFHHAKLAFLLWLQLPISDGARYCFVRYLRPFLLRHQCQLDWFVNGTRNELNKFVLSHQQEIRFVKEAAHRFITSGQPSQQNNLKPGVSIREYSRTESSGVPAASSPSSEDAVHHMDTSDGRERSLPPDNINSTSSDNEAVNSLAKCSSGTDK